MYRYVFVAFVFIMCGCTTDIIGRDIQRSDVDRIVKGATLSNNIITMFGEPQEKEIQMGNIEKWSYGYLKIETDVINSEKKYHNKALILLIRDGIVTDYYFLEKLETK